MNNVYKIWTKDALKKEANKYNQRTLFFNGNVAAYTAATRRGILDEICLHMESPFQSWDIGKIATAAKVFKTRGEFMKGNQKAYDAAKSRKCLGLVCKHMERDLGNRFNRFVYLVRDLENKVVYVGLTYNIAKRQTNHLRKGRKEVINLVRKFGLTNLTPKPLPVKEAARLEKRLIEKYRAMVGWNCLNKLAGGQL